MGDSLVGYDTSPSVMHCADRKDEIARGEQYIPRPPPGPVDYQRKARLDTGLCVTEASE